MLMKFCRAGLLSSSALAAGCALGLLPAPACAEAADATKATLDEVVVTGSRIHRAGTETAAPVLSLGDQDIVERGYVQVGDLLNKVTAVAPSFAQAPGTGAASGSGQQFPNLFNLGAGRTLTLFDGHRMVTSASGLGDRVVDTNIIPTGLIQKVDIVQAGGAAVYGSDAIAGVVNYVLKKNFDGEMVDVQYGQSSRGDYPKYNFTGVVGRNFNDGRGNIAIDFEWRKTDPLAFDSRPITNPIYRTLSNPLNKTSSDGIPSTVLIPNPTFWTNNQYGVIFTAPAPVLRNIVDQFSPDGQSVRAFNPGSPYVPGFACGVPFCVGGDGQPYSDLSSLYSGVETYSGTAIGHYDLTDHMRLSGSLLYARTKGADPKGAQAPGFYVIGSAAGGSAPIAFNRNNAFLTPAAIASLSALSPAFAAGGNLYLSKNYEDLLPTREFDYITNTYFANVSLDGDFNLASHNYYYNLSYTHGLTKGETDSYGVYTAHFLKAVNAVKNASGQIVCAVNAATVVDPSCVPLNPFGQGNITPAMRAYSVVRTGAAYRNTMDDVLATLGGDLFRVPAGQVKFDVAYEHRAESARNTPSLANQLGLVGGGVPTLPTHGSFQTDEYSAELLAPIFGGDFTLPGVRALEFTGQYRIVDNSIAGRESVWGAGLRWDTILGLTVRASRSRNFRAPTLTQLLAPQTTGPGSGILDPCDTRYRNTGPNPAVRSANCQALFAAHPSWGPLSNFTDPAVNFAIATVTSGGNPNLQNEVSDTTTFGLVWSPKFVPGDLVVTADRIAVTLHDGLTAFTATNFVQGCFDADPMPAALCSTFTRDPATGYIATARSTTFNAASVTYRGEVFNLNYRFPVEWIIRRPDSGTLELSIDATHNEELTTVVAGVSTQQAGTTVSPRWVVRSDLRYRNGPLSLTYENYFLPTTMVSRFDTVETTPYPIPVASNMTHSISASYDFGKYTVRAGVNNLTDKMPSFASVLNYGDIIGREFFVGLRASF